MKTLLITFALTILSLGTFAQRKGGYFHHAPVTRVVVTPAIGLGFGFGYPYFGYPYYPYGYPYYYGYGHAPYRLSSQIQAIKVDYRNRIKEARHDKSISHAQRRQEIRNLKAERAQAVADAERDFYNNRGRQNNSNNYNGNQ
ncbi:MAG TPA: hypothetical protein VHA52_04745 [Candidatus Babeliaceae bacterium]|nr:hypothetical protein [Candidatus Babeliaceae bacterium]HVZ95977.1 hypothetical protein [Chitinophagaceae bacterium]